MLKIGDFSKLSYISIRMLRYYDQHNLLKPAYIDNMTNYRFYDISQLETANIINRLKKLGFSIKIIREILLNPNSINQHFQLRIKAIEQELGELVNSSREINNLINTNYNHLSYNVITKTIPSRQVISIRRILNSYFDENLLWDELYRYIKKNNIRILEDNYAIAIFHDNEYKDKNVDVEVQVTVDKLYNNQADVKFYKTAELEVASIIFNGSYNQMPKVTTSALTWIENNNYELIQPTFNIYHISPAQENNINNFITESCFIVKERKITNGTTDN